MPENSWNKVEELFLAALELPSAERTAFLEQECGSDLELRQEAESLLAADAVDGRGIALIVEDAAASLFEHDAMTGKRLGAYRVVQEIGRGGMGVVYLAVRADQVFERHVAVKIVKRGVDTDAVLGRFRHERQILAVLNHPNIAGLMDGGTSADGRPYFVMEYVEGRPIQEFCREHELTIRQRCELFRKVCEPVTYAHRNLVIHRDLKPANILVTAEGSPKLLDFGIARLLSLDPGENTVGQTRSGSALTPAYASPEQRRGEAVNTSTDVYSLGAVLFEILTGQTPPANRDLSVERPIGKPSEAVQDRRLRGDLAGDLDNIVLKATHPEQERRYQSVDHLSEDIGRYLTGRPVLAREDRFTYRAAKFIRRHRLAVVSGGLMAIALTAGVTMVLWEARQAELQRQRAERRVAQLVELSNRTLFDVHAAIETLPGTLDARQVIIRTTLQFLKNLEKDAAHDEPLRLALSAAYLRLGDLQGDLQAANFGDVNGALQSYRAGGALLEPLPAAGSANSAVLLLWLNLQQKIGLVLIERGDLPGSLVVLPNALRVATELARLQPESKETLRSEANIQHLIAVSVGASDERKALQYANQYLETVKQLVKKFPGDPQLQYDLALAHNHVGSIFLLAFRDPYAAAPYYESCLAEREELVRDHPNDTLYRRVLMLSYEHFAGLQGNPLVENLGRPDLARKYYQKAQVLEEAAFADPKNHIAQYDYAGFLEKSAMLDVPRSGLAESLATLRKAAAMFEQFSAAAPGVLRYHRELTQVYLYAGHRLFAMGKYDEAVTEYNRVLSHATAVLSEHPEDHPSLGRALDAERGISQSLMQTGDRAGALEHARRLLASARQGVAVASDREPLRPYVAEAHLTLASLYRSFKDCSRARESAQEAIALLRPLVAGRERDQGAKTLHEAETLLAECGSR
jgi:tetratricopeptide (TPR) repeat protein/predicted Ser/Thr protein kinase